MPQFQLWNVARRNLHSRRKVGPRQSVSIGLKPGTFQFRVDALWHWNSPLYSLKKIQVFFLNFIILAIIIIIIMLMIIFIIIIIIIIITIIWYNISTTWWEKRLDIWELPTLWNVKDPPKDENCSKQCCFLQVTYNYGYSNGFFIVLKFLTNCSQSTNYNKYNYSFDIPQLLHL